MKDFVKIITKYTHKIYYLFKKGKNKNKADDYKMVPDVKWIT